MSQQDTKGASRTASRGRGTIVTDRGPEKTARDAIAPDIPASFPLAERSPGVTPPTFPRERPPAAPLAAGPDAAFENEPRMDEPAPRFLGA